MNMSAIMDWVRANVLIVVFVLLMIGALVAGPILAGGLRDDVRTEIAKRGENITKLAALENVVLPGNVKGVVNERLLSSYRELVEAQAGDAQAVQKLAVEHNRKGRDVLMPGLLPEAPYDQLVVLPQRFHEALVRGYSQLLEEVSAGGPPLPTSLQDELTNARQLYITQNLKKDSTETLTAEEQEQLTQYLSTRRMALLKREAERHRIYLTADVLNVPAWNQAQQPTLPEIFNWQWQYWVMSDILRAINQVNEGAASVTTAPVKQVLALTVSGLPAASDQAGGGGGAGLAGAAAAGFGEERFGETAAAPATGAVSAAAPTRNYAMSFTGLQSNALYDVLIVNLHVVVETQRLPQLLDALANYNFMTVTSLFLLPADPFGAAAAGYFYGNEPVSQVGMTIETVWLREWTSQFMPAATRAQLGIASPQPATAQEPAPEPPPAG